MFKIRLSLNTPCTMDTYLSLIFSSDASTRANAIILISPWKRSWCRQKHKDKDQNILLCLSLCFHMRALQWVKTKYHPCITQAQGYLPHVIMFSQWKHWIQITSRLNRFPNGGMFGWFCLCLCFHLGHPYCLPFCVASRKCKLYCLHKERKVELNLLVIKRVWKPNMKAYL